VERNQSERNQSERNQSDARDTSLLRSERLFRTTYERAAIGIAHVSPEGRWLRFNQRLCELLGYSRAELAARTFQDLTHPDDLAASLARQQRLLSGEQDTDEWDKRYVCKDGTLVWTHVTVSLVRTAAGAPDYFISMVQDIGERKRLEEERARLLERERAAHAEAEAALARASASEARAAERAERLRAILETMADGVGVYDDVGRIVQCNRAYRALLAVDRVPGFEAIPLADRAPLFDIRDATGAPLPVAEFPAMRALRGELLTGPGADIRIRALDGRELEANLSAAPLRDGAGRVVGAVSVIHDLTGRRRLERERAAARAQELALRQLNRRKDEFLSVMSHELRTPLSSLQGYIQLLARHVDAWRPPEHEAAGFAHSMALVRTLLGYSEESLQRLARLADDLVDDARIRAGRLDVRLAPCDLCAIVRAAVEKQRALAPDRTIQLGPPAARAPDGPVQVIPVEADADRIAQVITNYLTNALKYSNRERAVAVRIEVASEADGVWARVSVRDEGPGLSPADRGRVWERFPRIEAVAVQCGSGVSLGLGLSISKAIVEAHGGRVGVESVVGEGSTFWFSVPLAGDRSVPRTGPAGTAP
jgi:PAS domain S-box-containing protein